MLEKILFVDDDVLSLEALEQLIMNTDYNLITAQSGEDALKVLEEEQVDIIVCDMEMPKMNGYELLSKVKELYPEIIRIIVSEIAEERTLFNALQKNIAKSYILKPWEDHVFIGTLEKVFQVEDILKNKNVLKLINSTEGLPTIKTSYEKIINAIDNEREIYKIVDVIESDYSVASKLLHIVNSSYYGVKTGSIKRTVSYLGLDNIKNIVIVSAFIDSLSFNSKYSEKFEQLWKQSFISNRIFNIIYCEFLNRRTPETAMAAGLLTNIGIAFLLHSFKEKYVEIFDRSKKNNEDIITLENETFGTNHQEIGGYLLRWWDMPLPIVESALYHHNSFDENVINREIVCVAHISDKYAWEIMNENYFGEFNEKVFDELEIDKEKFEMRINDTLELNGLL